MPNKKIAILGLGWLGEPLAKELFSLGYAISGTTTCLEKLERLSKNPYLVGRVEIKTNRVEGDLSSILHNVNILIINFPPKRTKDVEERFVAQIEQVLPFLKEDMKVLFVGSTSVYQNTNNWVDESLELFPEKSSGKAILKAEKILQEYCGNRLTVLRLAGLIGPNRHPGKFLAEKRVLKNAEVPVNLIHLNDVIGLIKSTIEGDFFGHIINGCADKHPLRKEFYQKAAKELNITAPKFVESNMNSYKLVSNEKSKVLLGYNYIYENPEKIFGESKIGEIKIVGAGPGDKNLLTLEAYNAIKDSDIILHDNLVSTEILSISNNSEKVYVGRKYGDQSNQSDRQTRINESLKLNFQLGKKVVRLKSGDPYIYGRAAEEARYLLDNNIPFKVLPGISAAIAAANQCNIPITERTKSNSILICTAHTADYSFEQLKGIAGLLKAGNTLALYMGLKSLDKVIPKLIEVCNDATIPVNAISNVSRTNSKMVSSTLENIRTDLAKNPLELPVVFLIGINPITKE